MKCVFRDTRVFPAAVDGSPLVAMVRADIALFSPFPIDGRGPVPPYLIYRKVYFQSAFQVEPFGVREAWIIHTEDGEARAIRQAIALLDAEDLEAYLAEYLRQEEREKAAFDAKIIP